MLSIQPNPDFNRLKKAVFRQGEPDRVPFIELFADIEIIETILGEPIPIPQPGDTVAELNWLKKNVEFRYITGFDYVHLSPQFTMEFARIHTQNTAELAKSDRFYIDEENGMIANWQDFENYPWPKPESVDYSSFEKIMQFLPEGMGIIGQTSGILEYVMWLTGYTKFSYLLYDDEPLIQSLFDKIGNFFVSLYQTMADFDHVGMFFIGDDMGHKHGTMISPEMLRKYVFPWHKKLIDICHAKEKPILLHSCGNLDTVMDDIISLGFDGKHSFEDAIMPVTEAKKKYGHRISILGGVDVDFLCQADEPKIRKYVRNILRNCAPGGGYAFGTGNSVANYIPVQNYLTMLDEGWKSGFYPYS
ncbi:MAG: uroporphyrinogen-III decarboxylase-like protein [bacterium]|nr:uroporphyrinogen-III decarboxylase-like protein [bacterium]